MNKVFSFSVFILLSICSFAQGTLTDSLTKKFNFAWNAEDIPAMFSMLQPTAFFKSPYQLRYGRDTMAATVLTTNPPAFKFIETIELYSHAENYLAWSIGEFTCEIYDDEGNKTDALLYGTYTYVFTRKEDEDWKLQMMIAHEE